jgi:hypothetical protein
MTKKTTSNAFNNWPKLLWGDWLVLSLSTIAVTWLFLTLWQHAPASKLRIRQGNLVYGTFSLNQTKTLHVHGALADAIIAIDQGKVRFKQSPCGNQYCVHQGWLSKSGQVAVCLPNQISIELLGANKPFDTLNY